MKLLFLSMTKHANIFVFIVKYFMKKMSTFQW